MAVSSILMIHAYELNHTLHLTLAVVLLGILHLICSPPVVPRCHVVQ